MHALTVIGIAFIAAVVVDVGLSLLNPGHWLPVAICGAIGEVGTLASLFVVPGWFIFTSVKTRALNSLALRAFLAVMVTWFLAIVFRSHFSLPALRATARLRNDPDYNGIGGHAAVLLGGWIFPLFVTVIMAVVQQRRLVAQRSQNASSSSVLPDSVAAPEERVGK